MKKCIKWQPQKIAIILKMNFYITVLLQAMADCRPTPSPKTAGHIKKVCKQTFKHSKTCE